MTKNSFVAEVTFKHWLIFSWGCWKANLQLWHRVLKPTLILYIYIYIYIYKQCVSSWLSPQWLYGNSWPKCMSCHKAIVVTTGRTHCFHNYFYIILSSCSVRFDYPVDHESHMDIWPVLYIYISIRVWFNFSKMILEFLF